MVSGLISILNAVVAIMTIVVFAPAFGQFTYGGPFNLKFEVVQKESDLLGNKAFDITNYSVDFRGLNDKYGYENFVLVEYNDVSMSSDRIMLSGVVNAEKKALEPTTTKETIVFEMSVSVPIDRILEIPETGETKYIADVGNNGQFSLNEINFPQPLTELTLTGEEGSQKGTLTMRSYRQ
jgi:hypothetical protein